MAAKGFSTECFGVTQGGGNTRTYTHTLIHGRGDLWGERGRRREVGSLRCFHSDQPTNQTLPFSEKSCQLNSPDLSVTHAIIYIYIYIYQTSQHWWCCFVCCICYIVFLLFIVFYFLFSQTLRSKQWHRC